MGTSNVTLFAIWKKYTIKIIFDSNGGTGIMEDQIYYPYTSNQLSKNRFTFDGYSFQGWSTIPEGSIEYKDLERFKIGNSDIRLYANWS